MMRVSMVIGTVMATMSVSAAAQDFPGKMIAAFYHETMSTPKGWTLTYEGRQGNNQVFLMDRDFDIHANDSEILSMVQIMQPIDQVRRLCKDPSIAAMINGPVKWRIDSRDKIGGKTTRTTGPVLERC